MRRLVDIYCSRCDLLYEAICEEDEQVACRQCHDPAEQRWWPTSRRERTQIDERDAVVVFRKPDGTYSYPAVNTKPTPSGCERIVMRSRREVERHEREAGVRNEHLWFDRNGRGFDGDETMRPAPKPVDPELLRYLNRSVPR
jgi:hypothetical protein